jgi:hypothetical protein
LPISSTAINFSTPFSISAGKIKALAGGNKGKQGKGERVRGCGGWISFLNKTIVIDVARI